MNSHDTPSHDGFLSYFLFFGYCEYKIFVPLFFFFFFCGIFVVVVVVVVFNYLCAYQYTSKMLAPSLFPKVY